MIKDAARPFERTFAWSSFKNDKFYTFTPTSVTVMAGWPRMLAWKRSARKPSWRMLRPKIGLHNLEHSAAEAKLHGVYAENESLGQQPLSTENLKQYSPWLQWCSLVPREIREQVEPFPSRHWHLLSMASRCGQAAVDLMHTNPALAWALASSWVFRYHPVQAPMRSIRRLLANGRSQREAMLWLGFPDSKSTRKILAKVEHRSISVSTLLTLQTGLKNAESMHLLQHLPTLNASAIRMACDPTLRPWVTPNLLRELVANKLFDARRAHKNTEYLSLESALLLRDSLRMHVEFGNELPGQLRPLGSMEELEYLHARLTANSHMAHGYSQAELERELCNPPFKGDTSIVPLTTRQVLIEEGATMHHCVASYASLVSQGSHAIYRVLAPERATLSIVRTGKGWRIEQIKAVANAEVQQPTRQHLQRWLSGNGA